LKEGFTVNLGNLLLSLSESVDMANQNSPQHQLRTAFIALELARCLNLDEITIENIFIASLLHDIGKKIDSEENIDYELQCIRGQLFVQRVPLLESAAEIIRYHFLDWKDWKGSIDKPLTISSQIILLANFVDMMISRDRYILHQVDNIWKELIRLEDGILNTKVVGGFKEILIKEEFWFDLTSNRLYSILLHDGPLKKKEINLNELASMGELFKGVIDFKSKYTITHTAGVSACSEMLGNLFGLTELEVKVLGIAANFHDLGKLAVPNNILEKEGKLSKEEFEIVKSHPYYTYQVLNSIGGLQQIVQWASYHHERLDGSGYPFHCVAKDLDTGARIIAVSDIFISRLERKSYRNEMEKDEIFEIMKKMGRNNFIDMKFVDLLFDNFEIIVNYIRIKQEKTMDFYKNYVEYTRREEDIY
jgi:HD-GYP domain-containing protein (c-di-GMP phosphodiesterase class II)